MNILVCLSAILLGVSHFFNHSSDSDAVNMDLGNRTPIKNSISLNYTILKTLTYSLMLLK